MKWTTYVTLLGMIIAAALYVFADDYKFNQRIKPPVEFKTDTSPIDYSEPYQDVVNFTETDPIVITQNNRTATLHPRAYYEISGLLIGKNTYFGVKRYSTTFDTISPIDFAIAWGTNATKEFMENNIIVSMEKDFSDGGRYVYLDAKTKGHQIEFTVDNSNNHLIPKNENIFRALMSAKKYDEVYLIGMLVDVEINGKLRHITSLTRYDNGAGACEIMYVTEVRINDKVYN